MKIILTVAMNWFFILDFFKTTWSKPRNMLWVIEGRLWRRVLCLLWSFSGFNSSFLPLTHIRAPTFSGADTGWCSWRVRGARERDHQQEQSGTYPQGSFWLSLPSLQKSTSATRIQIASMKVPVLMLTDLLIILTLGKNVLRICNR